ncbi:peptide antibiotic transporter SbmA [Rhizobium sp. G21]|uniref:peptide antibiotic transporter SbmA n=1 Tax=Rhizobium sp. G21 TaxID=2758439 RepID=UPI0016003614|nr:peptide antibiotic transporter SbmA [Rhizobium sp. G21]MBB1250353.1 peptide antibiotic transporter SbmA [Rhizobium sp. G21]
MFESFFPKPKLALIAAFVWFAVGLAVWFTIAPDLQAWLGMQARPGTPPDDLSYFITPDNIFFYAYFLTFLISFGVFWTIIGGDHPWKRWSIWGSIYITFFTYFSVDTSVAITYWRGPFYNMIVEALNKPGTVSQAEIYYGAFKFFQIASVSITAAVFTLFFTSHYLFRWRNAMTDYYYDRWTKVRHLEGASQRIQEDTMRFSRTVEGLGTSLIGSFMTLIVYLPLLATLSENVKELPIIGEIPHPLMFAAIFWSIFGTLLMIVAGIKLPGLEFQNQRVEAAYRKELVYGEDSPERAEPVTVRELFSNIRKNNFRMFWHYSYFNFFRYLYLQTDNIFPILILVPSFAAGVITFGAFQQIRDAFGNVTSSFQYLVNSWPTMIELISIYKRLQAFEAAMNDEPLPSLDQKFIESGGEEKV